MAALGMLVACATASADACRPLASTWSTSGSASVAAIGLGGAFLHLDARLNFYRMFNEALDAGPSGQDFDVEAMAAGQRAAAAVTERAGQRPIAEGNDAALENAGRAVVSMSLAKREPDADAEVLNEAVQFLAGRRIGTDCLDPVHERHGLLELRLDIRRRLAMLSMALALRLLPRPRPGRDPAGHPAVPSPPPSGTAA
jgi:hypothetical protein